MSDVELNREREHLAEARRQLGRMRERTAALSADAAGDWVSREVLESTFALRMRQLADDPSVPLFFGRVDYAEPGTESHPFHIGRRHVSDPAGDPLVVDWRAPVSLPFYRASRAEPMGVGRRRRYGFDRGVLTAFEDEDLTAAGSAAGEDHSEILEAEIERPRAGPMRDIVATIQPEQDVIVRADLAETICVQGAPGTGKTAVGLHRAAYLLYAHREQLTRQGVLVVGPNASFLGYIRDVLPALGEVEATQTTIEDLVADGRTVRGSDPTPVAVLKGDARLAAVIERALWSRVTVPAEGLMVPRGSRRWRVSVDDVADLVASLRARGVRYGAGRGMLPQSLAHRVLVEMERSGDSPDDRVQDAVARSRPVKDYVTALWPALDAPRLLWELFTDAEALAGAADGILSEEEQRLLLWERRPRSAGASRWSLADLVLLDEAADQLARTPSLAHVVVDEAQDLSPMMLRALARRSATGSLTVLGDLAQATTPWASRSWEEALQHLGKPGAHVEQLTRGFRVPGEVIDYAARLLPHIAPQLDPPTSVRRARGELVLTDVVPLPDLVRGALAREGTVGVIVPDARLDDVAALLGEETATDARVEVLPAGLAKGLEFDHVVLLDPAAIVAAEPDRVTGLRRLYVCLTRAVTSLAVRHDGTMPPELAGDP